MRVHILKVGFLVALSGAIACAQLPPFAGPFTYGPALPVFPGSVQLRDLDGDGRDDLFQTVGIPIAHRYRLSNANGTLGQPYELSAPPGGSTTVQISDLGDGTPELFRNSSAVCPGPGVVGWLNAGLSCQLGGQGLALTPFAASLPCVPVLTRLQDYSIRGSIIHASVGDPAWVLPPVIQTCSFTPPSMPGGSPTITQLAPPYAPVANPNVTLATLYACELDGDGMPDVLIGTQPFGVFVTTFEVARWTPAGLVLNAPTPSITVPSPSVVNPLIHDLTADGRDEVLLRTPIGCVVYGNQVAPGGGVLLTPGPAVAPGFFPRSFDDIDGDGDVDVIGANAAGQEIRVLLNDGAGNLTLSLGFLPSANASAVTSGDLDGDGDTDLVTGGSDVQVWVNQTVPTVAAYPGTGDPIAMASNVHPSGVPPTSFSGAPFFDIKPAAGTDAVILQLVMPPLASGAAIYTLVETFPTGCPPVFPARKVWSGFGIDSWIIGPYALPAGLPITWTFTAPPFVGVQNRSAIVQFVFVTPNAYNGVYASTPGHEFQF
jgi:FG-GAP-like repeat